MRLVGRKLLRSRFALVSIALAVALPACARVPESGVNVRPLSTELVFGVPEITEEAAPPNFTDPSDPLPVLDIPSFRGSRQPPFVPPDDAPPAVECPTAPPDAFPVETTTGVRGVPKQGTYAWRYEGSQNVPQVGTQPVPSMMRKTVKNVNDQGTGTFRYDVEEREVLFGSQRTITQTFEVRQGGAIVGREGIYLIRILTRGADGSVSRFEPSDPVPILYLPVQIGTQSEIDAVGVDPVTQQVLRHRSVVLNRWPVDACGTPLQGWFVDGERQWVNENQQRTPYTGNYNYMMATHMGGIMIWEHLERPCTTTQETSAEEQREDPKNRQRCDPAGDLRYFARIGQAEPDPA